ncbi:unnamed protein product [Tilletia controversa]|nr:unnamed protein product [Tilletia controversa]CAD6927496.1 unnamed protein product [Tilletia controversa]
MMSAPSPYPIITDTTSPLPDDAQINSVLPSICVDYLSHHWDKDEQIWASWKAMTKSKNEITNGVRLENASWRTWAKQRGKLKTISPETLNWLKDSDVTYLYGPLHEKVLAVPPPREATFAERLGLDESDNSHLRSSGKSTPRSNAASPALEKNMSFPSSCTAAPGAGSRTTAAETSSSRMPPAPKSILKHRTISDVLGAKVVRKDVSPSGSAPHARTSPVVQVRSARRGNIFSVQSDTNLAARGAGAKSISPDSNLGDARRRHSGSDAAIQKAKRIDAINEAMSTTPESEDVGPSSFRSESSLGSNYNFMSAGRYERRGLPGGGVHRHISFNHRVEQCIALDDTAELGPKSIRPAVAPNKPPAYSYFVGDSDDDDPDAHFHPGMSEAGFDDDFTANRPRLFAHGAYQDSYDTNRSSYRPGFALEAEQRFLFSDSEEEEDEDEEEEEGEEDDDVDSDSDAFTMGSSSATSAKGSFSETGRKLKMRLANGKPQLLTIAKLAPTLLKTSEAYPSPSPAVVDPSGYLLTLPGTQDDSDEELQGGSVGHILEPEDNGSGAGEAAVLNAAGMVTISETELSGSPTPRAFPEPSFLDQQQRSSKDGPDKDDSRDTSTDSSSSGSGSAGTASTGSASRGRSRPLLASEESEDRSPSPADVSSRRSSGSYGTGPGDSDVTIVGVSPYRSGGGTTPRGSFSHAQHPATSASAASSGASIFNHYHHRASDGPSGPLPIRASRHHMLHGPNAGSGPTGASSSSPAGVDAAASASQPGSLTGSYDSSASQSFDGSAVSTSEGSGSGSGNGSNADLSSATMSTPGQSATIPILSCNTSVSGGSYGYGSRAGSDGRHTVAVPIGMSLSSSTSSSSLCSLDYDDGGDRRGRGRTRDRRSGPGSCSSSFDRLSDAAQAAHASGLATGWDVGSRSRSRSGSALGHSSSSSSLQSLASGSTSDRFRNTHDGSLSPCMSSPSPLEGPVGGSGSNPRRSGGRRQGDSRASSKAPPAATRGRSRIASYEQLYTKGSSGISIQIGSASSGSGSSAESSRRNSIQSVPLIPAPAPAPTVAAVPVKVKPDLAVEGGSEDTTPVMMPRRYLGNPPHVGAAEGSKGKVAGDSTSSSARNTGGRGRSGSASGSSGENVPTKEAGSTVFSQRSSAGPSTLAHPRLGSAAISLANSSPAPAPGTPVAPEPPTTSTTSENAARVSVGTSSVLGVKGASGSSVASAHISPALGMVGPSPGSTPTMRAGKRRSDSVSAVSPVTSSSSPAAAAVAAAAGGAISSHRRSVSSAAATGGAVGISGRSGAHRRSSSTHASGASASTSNPFSSSFKSRGPLSVPRDGARAGITEGGLILSPDHVYEEEGSLVGRAVEFVNTARDLVSALWGGVSAGGRPSFSGGR